MKYIKLLFIILLAIPFSGCYNYRELNDLGITTAIGVTKDNDEYKLYIEVLKTEQGSSKEAKAPEFIVFESTGKTIQEASRRSILESSKRLYINHLSVLIIDEKLAKDGIKDIMDIFFRDPESRKQFYVLVTKENLKELLNTEGLLETLNSKSISSRLKVNEEYLNSTMPITFSKLLTKYVNPNKEMIMPSLKLVDTNTDDEDKPKQKIVIDNTAIFKEDKLIGYINNEESLYLNLIDNEVHDTVLTTFNKKDFITIEINNSNTKLDVKDRHIKININLSGNIAEINDITNLTSNETINYIEKLFEKDLADKTNEFITKIINEYNTDIFGFTDLIYKKDYKNYNNLTLKDITYEVNCKIKLKFKGNGAYELNEKD